MIEVEYFALEQLLDQQVDMDFRELGEYGEKTENILLNHDILKMDIMSGNTYNGSVSLTENGFDLCMEDIESVLGKYGVELYFDNLEQASL